MQKYFIERDTELLKEKDSRGEVLLRKAKILKSKLKRNAISHDEFVKQVKKLDEEYKTISSNSHYYNPDPDILRDLRKLGILNNKDQVRQNKNHKTELKNLKNGTYQGRAKLVDCVVDGETLKNIMRVYNICRTTDNEREYKQCITQLKKWFKVPDQLYDYLKDGAIQNIVSSKQKNGTYYVYLVFNEDVIKDNTENSNLYHTSRTKNITRLNGKLRSNDGVLFPQKRIYFGKNSEMGRNGYKEKNSITYTPKERIKEANIDTEFGQGGPSRFIKADHIDVKDINHDKADSTMKHQIKSSFNKK